ncbi:MAG: PQQ-binding-like beta-propeller repeat protein [Cellulomonas sp.]
MRASGRDMQDVVLVEGSDAPLGAAGEPIDSETPLSWEDCSPSLARAALTSLVRTRAPWSLIAGVLAIVVGTSGVLTAQQERARMAALAGLPGILRPLDGPVAELWRVGSDSLFINGLTGFGGRVLLIEQSTDGTADVVALDAGTGEEAWRVQAQPAREPVADSGGAYGGGANCSFPRSTDAQQSSVVACVVTDESISVQGADTGVMLVGTRAHLLVIDATTGAVVSQSPIEPTASVALLGPDLVTGQFAADGRVQVTRSGARDGTLSWTFTSPDPVPSDASGQRNLWVWANEGFIDVRASSGTGADGRPAGGASWLISPEGAVVRERLVAPGADDTGLEVLQGGATIVETSTTTAGAQASVLTDAASGRTLTVEAIPTFASPDDGSLGSAILMQSTDGALLAYDLTTGQPRWTDAASVTGGGLPMILDGRVVRSRADNSSTVDITSIDGDTGTAIWSTSLTSNQGGSLLTDGRVILVSRTGSTPGARAVIAAYDLADGRQRWEVPTGGEQWLVELDGRVFGMSGRGLVAYG